MTYSQGISPEKLLDSGWFFHQRNVLDSSEYFYYRAFEHSAATPRIKGQAHLNLANLYAERGDYYSSIKENEVALEYFEQLQNHVKIFHCLRNIGLNYNGQGLYKKSLEFLYRAEKYAQASKNPKLSYLVNVSIGRVYEEMEEYDEALIRYVEANQFARNNGLTNDYNGSLINIGNVFLIRKAYDSAISYYAMALQASEQVSDNMRIAYAANNLGIAYLEKQELQEAGRYLTKALRVKEEISPNKLPSTQNALAKYYMALSDWQKPIDLLNKAISASRKQNNMEYLLESYEILKDYHQRLGEYDMALSAMEILDSLKTHRFNTEKLAVNKLKASYDLQKREEQIAQQEQKLRQERLIRWVILVTTLIIIFIAFFFYRLFKTNLRLKKKNELLLKEQNHRVKNNLQMISSLLSLQSQNLPSLEAQGALSESQARINSVALLHRMLYEGEELGKVELIEYLKSLTEEIKYAVPRLLSVNYQMPSSLPVEIETATSLGLIVNELVTNSVKHVSEKIELMISLEVQVMKGEFRLIYMDNGPGMDQKSWERSSSFGNQLIRIQSQQLRGTYAIDGQDGFHFTLTRKM